MLITRVVMNRYETMGMNEAGSRSGRNSELQELRQRISSLEAEAAGMSLAQVLTRSFAGEIRYWSHGMERLYGFTPAEALGRISHDLLRTEFPRSRGDVDTELLERGEWTGELRQRRRDGQEIVVVSHQSLQPDAAGATPLVTEVNNDITEMRRGHEARQYLASIVESSEDAIVGKTLEGVVTAWNGAAEGMFGYSAGEMIGQPISRLLPPDRVHEEAMILDRLRRGERLRQYETVRLRKDGGEIAVSLTISPILDRSGAIIGASKIVRDITAERRSQSHIQELQAELAHVARLTTMGQMASAIAHELNQPLTAVGNYASALGRVLANPNEDPDRARVIVDRIRQQTTRAGAVIRRLREHVAKRNSTRQREDVNGVVKEAVELGLVGTQYRGVHTAIELDAAVGPAMLDRIQIGQVIINLVRNAVEAMEAGNTRKLTVSTRAVPGMVEIAVTDTGPGIAPEVAERLFQPFVTSKATGLGLGLSICRELVEAHQGRLSVASGATGGTVFVITLPIGLD
jgi:two-component system, LuxR family, sensor kinase FixL